MLWGIIEAQKKKREKKERNKRRDSKWPEHILGLWSDAQSGDADKKKYNEEKTTVEL